jgi:hypothetical protein
MADTSGSTMANSDPKTRKSTMPASRMPRPVPPMLGGLAFSATWPATATSKVGEAAFLAVSTNSCASEVLTDCPPMSKLTDANAMRSFSEIWFGAAYGETMRETCGTFMTSASDASMAAFVAASWIEWPAGTA